MAASFALASTALATDWQHQITATPGSFPLPRPLHATYHCGWAAVSAADLDVNFSRRGDILRVDFNGSTTGVARSLWRLDATQTARARVSTMLPIDLKQVENYKAEIVRTNLDFTPDEVTKFRETQPPDKTPSKKKRFDFPNVLDLHTALLFVRSQKLKGGDTVNVVVFPASAPYLATVRVLGREQIKVKAGKFPAIKLDLKLQRITANLDLESHQKFKRATAWLSDDADRMLLKVQAEIFVGSVWTELTSFKTAGR